jgi:glycosyltransferase involved in cell wall biosynthesis
MISVAPKISVIITAHNEERFIGRCLRSIINQTLWTLDYEVIVVNDASSDKTGYALELFGNSVTVINNETNLGLPASINRGIKSASGHYIVRLDADDYVNVNYLKFLSFFLDSNEEYDAVACDYILVDDSEKVLERCDASQKPIGCGIMFKREHLLDLGLYDESFWVHEDKDLRLRFEKVYKVGHLNLPLYRYRKHSKNMTNDTDLMTQHESRLNRKHHQT